MVLPLLADGVATFPGIAGVDGQDGMGVEYIFAATLDPFLTISQLPLDNWGFDQPGTVGGLTWEDGAPNVDENRPYLWRSARTVPGTPAVGSAVLDSWRVPVVVGRWGPDGQPGLAGIAGSDGTDGVPGEDGFSYEYVFAATGAATLPQGQHPDNTWGFDEPGIVDTLQWHDGAAPISSARPYLWRAQRRTEGAPPIGDPVSAIWSEPVIVGRWGLDGQPGLDGIPGADGTDGLPGADGVGTEWVFARTNSATLPQSQRPDDAWGFDAPSTVGGLTWHDGALTLDSNFQYLWQSQRRTHGLPADGTAVTDPWRPPVIVGRFGPQGIQGLQGIAGADGDDGEGLEGIYAVWNKDTLVPSQYPKDDWTYLSPMTTTTATRKYRVFAINQDGLRSDPSVEVSP